MKKKKTWSVNDRKVFMLRDLPWFVVTMCDERSKNSYGKTLVNRNNEDVVSVWHRSGQQQPYSGTEVQQRRSRDYVFAFMLSSSVQLSGNLWIFQLWQLDHLTCATPKCAMVVLLWQVFLKVKNASINKLSLLWVGSPLQTWLQTLPGAGHLQVVSTSILILGLPSTAATDKPC